MNQYAKNRLDNLLNEEMDSSNWMDDDHHVFEVGDRVEVAADHNFLKARKGVYGTIVEPAFEHGDGDQVWMIDFDDGTWGMLSSKFLIKKV